MVSWENAATISSITARTATFQALTEFGYSALFNANGGQHGLLFLVSAGAILTALALGLLPRMKNPAGH
ncbi:hypothetical protein [Pseudomonas sp. R1-15]|uniref:hypothetical protein n=1 Tax=Pseudomonas sp. R1-15 TaxID=2817399 RepID=UPI003DA7E860